MQISLESQILVSHRKNPTITMYLIVENEYNPQREPRHPWNDYTWIGRIKWSACYPAAENPWNATSPLAGPGKDDNIPPSSSPVQFSLFQRLPFEIREMIWGFALAAIGPRNVYLKEKAQRRPKFQGYRVRSDIVTGEDYPDERLFRMVILSPSQYEQVKSDFRKLGKNKELPEPSHPYPVQHSIPFYDTVPGSPGSSYYDTDLIVPAYDGHWIRYRKRFLGYGWVQIEFEDRYTRCVPKPICGWGKTCALPTIIFTCREVFAVASRSRTSLPSLGCFGNNYLDVDREILVLDEYSFKHPIGLSHQDSCYPEIGRTDRNESLLSLCYKERHRIQRLAFQFEFEFTACNDLSFILSQFDNLNELILFVYDQDFCYEKRFGNDSYKESEIDLELYDPVSKSEAKWSAAQSDEVVAKVRGHLEKRSTFWDQCVERQGRSFDGGRGPTTWPTTLVVPKVMKFMLATRKPKGANTQVMMSVRHYREQGWERAGIGSYSSFCEDLNRSATLWCSS
ncbi:hypothetical protein HYALB_00001694 [Hymenoscyphus albidus]|uniref:2EXR domain-containing protein n=1 Tax=Hymenoscyphus albidus TaxID=595503 RepID=A0A9N9LDV3_9HELO|nr:hypothetical protein HYALB_00001694 [Hymenoscyphus albidus]